MNYGKDATDEKLEASKMFGLNNKNLLGKNFLIN